jgi:hypothetical protein
MAAPDFDSELNLHRVFASNGLIRMRMEAWVEGAAGKNISLTRDRRLMEATRGVSLTALYLDESSTLKTEPRLEGAVLI